ncbi:hypothetical protein IAR55_001810 [Kwoniella newhampshirensis]|uniref:NADP-dependent oxidoreductase domain-containing protein n=1 Tax=Kwoniella newhampshirensis TaxID=1651941 RepID=A0AAW0Z377_9TREE
MVAITDRRILADGKDTPIFVFGSRAESIPQALSLGWRGFDTAQEYGNEQAIGQAIRDTPAYKDGSITRPEIYVTSKLAGQSFRPQENLVESIKESVDKIGLEYIDLFIIHKPYGTPEGRKTQWLALVEAKKQGLVKSIGVSSFGPKHLEEIRNYSDEFPVVNQVEITCFNQEPALQAYCKKNNIAIQTYSPLARNEKSEDPTLNEVAKAVGRTWNQVMLRWSIQTGLYPVCASRRSQSNIENSQVFDFELSEDQMEKLNSLESGFRVCPENPLDQDDQPPYHWDGVKVTLL